MRHPLRAARVVLALTLTSLLWSPATATATANDGFDPAAAGAWWIEAQFDDDGAVIGRTGERDVPTTISATLGMAATGHRHAQWEATIAFVRDGVEDYVAGSTVDDYGPLGSGDRPGSLANLLLFVDEVDADPRDFGGHDLVARLEATEQPLGADAGAYGVQADVFGHGFVQATAVHALAVTEGAAPSAAAVAHLLDLQCASGGFPSGYRSAAERLVDDCTGDSNATGLALAGLASLGGHEDAVAAAVAFLDEVRTPEGGWGYTPGNPTDGNSTGLAALGMRLAGRDVTEAQAAVAGLQFDCSADPGQVGGVRFVATDAGPNTFATYQAMLAFDVDGQASALAPCVGANGEDEAPPAPVSETTDRAARADVPDLPVTGGGAGILTVLALGASHVVRGSGRVRD